MEKKALLTQKLIAMGIRYHNISKNAIDIHVCFRKYVRITFLNKDQIKLKSITKNVFGSVWSSLSFSKWLIMNICFLMAFGAYVGYVANRYSELAVSVSILFALASVIFIVFALYFAIRLEFMKRNIVDWLNV